MARLLPNQQKLEEITICGQKRVINVRSGTYQDTSWADAEGKLCTALAQYGISFAPFVEECGP